MRGREPSVFWAIGKLLHTENSAPLQSTQVTGWTTGRSLIMNPRSACPEPNPSSTPYDSRCVGMSCANAGVAAQATRAHQLTEVFTRAFSHTALALRRVGREFYMTMALGLPTIRRS